MSLRLPVRPRSGAEFQPSDNGVLVLCERRFQMRPSTTHRRQGPRCRHRKLCGRLRGHGGNRRCPCSADRRGQANKCGCIPWRRPIKAQQWLSPCSPRRPQDKESGATFCRPRKASNASLCGSLGRAAVSLGRKPIERVIDIKRWRDFKDPGRSTMLREEQD